MGKGKSKKEQKTSAASQVSLSRPSAYNPTSTHTARCKCLDICDHSGTDFSNSLSD